MSIPVLRTLVFAHVPDLHLRCVLAVECVDTKTSCLVTVSADNVTLACFTSQALTCRRPRTAKRHQAAGEADGDSDGDAGREGQPRSSLGAAGGADRDREASGKTFDFERILEDFVLLTFLARPAIAAYGHFPSAC